ncbi:serine-threonine protein kinase, putative [Entamoeba invadens IP1]|uniref:Serine-threonine protein kinase, putative n=1 Tax=Entamoeba invadens IP1 TaxID=370355 RepID=A0A0A1U731_ENTIV|nr:serine-threonine protein kinase, putative [Entamoeba invadens IP1]ELP90130.1 serine-threonine protein kinase, putative [Entamoeba invadens IP1]|eukprot:XP_004256901.1 serine-threonine protein kinase, putative [Entamoeba invadens IP1]
MQLLFLILFVYLALSEECACKKEDQNICVECPDNCQLQIVNSTSTVPLVKCFVNTDLVNCLEKDSHNSNVCLECKAGYFLSEGSCVVCPDHCLLCNATTCFSCETINNITYTVSSNRSSCINCMDETVNMDCGLCPEATYFEPSKSVCLPCQPNCKYCSSSLCQQCYPGYYTQQAFCNKIQKCQTALTSIDYCDVCFYGFYRQRGRCQDCSVLETNCWVCYHDEVNIISGCTICHPGYVKVQGHCISLADAHCKVGYSDSGCLDCEDTYYFDVNMTCQRCSEACFSCTQDPNNCLSCASGYYFNNDGICERKDSNCVSSDLKGCLECVDVLSMGTDLTGYYIPKDGTTCEICSEHCNRCVYNSRNCTSCVDGYVLKKMVVDGVQLRDCVEKQSYCVDTEMGFCVLCTDGYFLNGGSDKNDDQECVKCDKSCGSCEVSTECTTCQVLYYRPLNWKELGWKLCHPQSEINMTCEAGINGCVTCNEGYYINSTEPTTYKCSVCPERCGSCQYIESTNSINCLSCPTKDLYAKNGECYPCSDLPNCAKCSYDVCSKCKGGYSLEQNMLSCSRPKYELIIPLTVLGVVLIIVFLVGVGLLIWRERRRYVYEVDQKLKPFKVNSDLEMLLLGSDNKNFPMKTDKWELFFGLKKGKAIVDKVYEETLSIANMTNKTYFFEFYTDPSHRFDLEIEPNNGVLGPKKAATIVFHVKPLCTASIIENIGIVAMDMGAQVKETAKLTIYLDTDLSVKLDYTELKPVLPAIGEGGFGIVFKGKYRDRIVAIKKMKSRSLTDELEKEFNHEVSMLLQMRYVSVVELIGAIYTEGEIALVTEFAEYGSLTKVYLHQEMSYLFKVKVMEDVALALSYLHKNNIIHRDVKSENVLVFSLNPKMDVCSKLTDFGTSRCISEVALMGKKLTIGIGTPNYMSPECLRGNGEYGFPSDVYSFGVMMYETYTQKKVFEETDKRFEKPWMVPQFIIEGNRLEQPPTCPSNYWNLTNQCWAQIPEDRPTFMNVINAIESWGEDIVSLPALTLKNGGKISQSGGEEEDDNRSSSETSSSTSSSATHSRESSRSPPLYSDQIVFN